jgi:hypothetical protein
MKEGLQGKDENIMKQMMEKSKDSKSPKSAENGKNDFGSGLINTIEKATEDVSKKVGEGIIKMLNPLILFAGLKKFFDNTVAHPLVTADKFLTSADNNLRRFGK